MLALLLLLALQSRRGAALRGAACGAGAWRERGAVRYGVVIFFLPTFA